ncbi:MAG: hypothetical protein ABI831_03795 [Betaproteobacteria bacterium]
MSESGKTAGMTIPEFDSPGIIVVDRARKILFRNHFAETILGAEQSLRERHYAGVPA